MSVALATGENPDQARAAQIAAQTLQSWTGGSESVQLLSARWEAEDDPAMVTRH